MGKLNIITILIAALVAIAVSVVLKKFDKENNSMEKVRRYADKRLTEFDSYFKEQEKNLSNSRAELEGMRTQATAAIKRLENEKNEFMKEAGDFQKHKDIIASADQKIKEYDNSLSTLTEMTANVEENLNRLKKEFLVVGKLDDKINLQKKKIDEIESKIPIVTKEFSVKNSEQLKILGTKLLDEYDARTKKLEENISHSEKNAKDALQKLNQEISTVYNNAAQKAQTLEDVAFEKLNKQAEERSTVYVNSMKLKIDELQKQVLGKMQETENRVKDKTTQVESALNDHTNKLTQQYNEKYNQFVQKNNTQYKTLETEYNKKLQELNVSIKNTNNNVVANLKNSLTSLDEKYNQHIEKFRQEYDAKINSMHSKYENKLTSLDGINDKKISDLEEKFNSWYASSNETYSKKLEDLDSQVRSLKTVYSKEENSLLADINQKLSALAEKCNTEIENIRDDLNQSINESKQMSEYLSKNVSGNTDVLDSLQSDLDAKVQAVQERYDNLFNEAVSSADQKETAALEKFTAKADATIEKYHLDLNTKIASMKETLTETLREISNEANTAVKDAENVIHQLQVECESAEQKANELEPLLDGKFNAVEQTIALHRTKAEERLNDYERYITDAIRKMSEQCEIRQSDALKAIDSQLGSYKKDLAYQFTRLETSGKDVDSLENTLRLAMQEVQNRVLSDFNEFSKNQQKTQEAFASSVKADSDSIESQLKELEDSIEDLKQSAVGSVKAKLNDFEKSFDNDLVLRKDKMEEDLSKWKNAFEARLISLSDKYEDARADLEIKHNEALQKKLNAVQEKNIEQIAKISETVKESKKSLSDELKDIYSEVSLFKQNVDSMIMSSQNESDAYLKGVAEKYEKDMLSELKKVRDTISNNLSLFEADVKERQETSEAAIAAVTQEAQNWNFRIKQQFDDSKEMITTQLESLTKSSEEKIGDTLEKLENDFVKYAKAIEGRQNDLEDSVQGLQEKADASLEKYEKISQVSIKKFEDMYNGMLKDTEKRIAEHDTEAVKKLDLIREKINLLETQTEKQQLQFSSKMHKDAQDFQTSLGELNKELQAVRSHMALYEQADKMKKQLDEKISDLKNEFSIIDDYNKNAQKISESYSIIKKMNGEISQKVKDVESQRNRIDNVEQKYDRLDGMSEIMNRKIEDLQSTYDKLQDMEIVARNFQEKLTELTTTYERLDQKQGTIEHVANGIDESFENLKVLEKKLDKCSQVVSTFPKEIKTVQADVEKILKSGPKISSAVKKLDDLQSLLDETEKQMNAITSSKQGLGHTEVRLEELNKNIDLKLDTLRQITKKDLEKSPAKTNTRLTPRQKEQIRELRRQKWTVAQIAERMGKTQGEVEMVLEYSD